MRDARALHGLPITIKGATETEGIGSTGGGPNNPWDLSRTPGGSSATSAVGTTDAPRRR